MQFHQRNAGGHRTSFVFHFRNVQVEHTCCDSQTEHKDEINFVYNYNQGYLNSYHISAWTTQIKSLVL